jgi:2'-5' RNA ligase
MSEQIRSFIAFDIENEQVLNRLSAAQKLILETGADLRPVAPQNIHVTIRFPSVQSAPTWWRKFTKS